MYTNFDILLLFLLLDNFAVLTELDKFWLIFSDYREMPELDRYEDQGMDHEDYDKMNVDQRRAAERELDQVNAMRNRSTARAPAAFNHDDELSGEEDHRRAQARMMRGAEEVDDDNGLGDMTNVNEYGEAKEPLA